MLCQKCGTELKEGVLFCRECGCKVEIPQKRFCRECGAEFKPGAKFCENCGAELNSISAAYNQSPTNTSNTINQYSPRAKETSHHSTNESYKANTVNNISQAENYHYSAETSNTINAKQIYNSLKNDAYIRSQKKKNDALIPAIITAACIFIALGLLLAKSLNKNSSNSSDASSAINTTSTALQARPQRNGFNESTNIKYRLGNYNFYIPSYWKVDINDGKEQFRAYAETGGKSAMLLIQYGFDDADPVSFDMLRDEVEDGTMTKVFSRWYEKCHDISYIRYDTDDTDGYLFSAVFTTQGYSGEGEIYSFGSVEDNRWFFVSLSVTDNTDYSYTDDFIKIIDNIEKVSSNDLIIDSPYITITQSSSDSDSEIHQDNNVNQENAHSEEPIIAPYETPFDYAYKRQYATNYYGYYLIDVDTKKVVYFESSCPEYPYYGSYTGDTASQIKITFPNDGYYVTMTFTGGIGTGASVVIQDDTLRSPFDCVPVEDIAKKVEPYLE